MGRTLPSFWQGEVAPWALGRGHFSAKTPYRKFIKRVMKYFQKTSTVFPSSSLNITLSSFRFEKVYDKRSGIEANKSKVQALNWHFSGSPAYKQKDLKGTSASGIVVTKKASNVLKVWNGDTMPIGVWSASWNTDDALRSSQQQL